MLRLKWCVVIVLGCLMPLVTAYAQRDAGSITFSGFVGTAMPAGPEFFKDYYKMGLGYGGSVRYNLSGTSAIGADVIYQPFKLDSDAFLDIAAGGGTIPIGVEVEIEGGDVNVFIISANFIQYLTPPSSSAGLYAIVGGGYYTFTPKDITVKITGFGEMTEEADDSESGFGVNGGLGIELAFASNLSFFAEGRYHYTFVEIEDAPEEMGASGKIHFIGVIGGFRLSL